MSSDTVPVLIPPKEITERSLDQLHEMLAVHVESNAPGIVLDLLEVVFINSAGLGALVQIGMQLDGQGRRLAFARPEKPVERMLKLVGLDSKVPMFRTVEEASSSIGASTASQGR